VTQGAAAAPASGVAPLSELQLCYLVGRALPQLGGTGCWLSWELARAAWDPARLEQAWNALVTRHDALRTVFPGGATLQVLAAVPHYAIEHLDLRGDDAAPTRLAALRDSVFQTRTEPACWPLFRVALASTDDGMRLYVGFDMLAVDAAGIFRLLGELAQLHAGPALPLPPLAGTPASVSAARLAARTPERVDQCARYWQARVEDFPLAPALPLHQDGASAHRFERLEHRVPSGAWQAFQDHAASHGLQRVPAIVCAFSQVLARWTQQQRFALNLTVGKHGPGVIPDGVIGEFSSNLLLAVDCSAAMPFADAARAVGMQLKADLAHVDTSGVEVGALLSARHGERLLMPVVFSSLLHPHASLGALGRFVTGLTRTPQVALDCQVMDDAGALYLSWDVLAGYYADGLVADMFALWIKAIELLAADAGAWSLPLPLPLPPAQRARRAQVNATAVDWPAETLHARVLAQARATPAALALVAPDASLTYQDLAVCADELARTLRSAGVQRNELVAVALPRGWEQAVAVLGVQMAGAAYLPIDCATPSSRVADILGLGGCRFAIAGAHQPLADGVTRIALAAHFAPAAGAIDAGPAGPDDLAYVIFTSGSTGTPKGVMIRHRAAANTVRDINERFALTAGDRVLALSSLNFDLSVWDIFGTLSAGGAVVFPQPDSVQDPAYLKAMVETHRVTIWNSVPSHLQMLAEHPGGAPQLASLRLAMLSGDWIPVTLPGRLAVPIVSLGGATEASIWSIAYPIEQVPAGVSSIPYGKPLANQRFHVFDAQLRDCPDGIAGELYIGGVGLADGYWGSEQQSAASFIVHPHSGERLYRTGDWGRYHADGNIEFLGRGDGQVKISGHRVELGEVEAALGRCAGVALAVAVTFADDHGQKRLAAFYTGDAAEAAVRGRLQSLLPSYMVPLRLVALDSLPLTANGKVDRKALASLAATPPRKQSIERLFGAPAVLADAAERKALVAAAGAIRHDLDQHAGVPLQTASAALGPGAAALGSMRRYDGVVGPALLGALLHVLCAETRGGCARHAYPSAGDSYSVQTYVQVRAGAVAGLAAGLYYYHPLRHALVYVAAGEGVDARIHVPANAAMAAAAAFTLFFVAQMDALEPLYGDMSEPFAWMEAGHMAQLLRQSSAGLGLGLCLVGAYDAAPVLASLGLGPQHLALAAMTGGVPADARTAGVPPAALPAAASAAAAVTSLEQQVAAIWCHLLGLEQVKHDEPFFEIGGTSFTMLAVQQELATRLGRQVSVTDLFRHTTVARLAAHLDCAGGPALIAVAATPQVMPDTVTETDPLRQKREMRRALRRTI